MKIELDGIKKIASEIQGVRGLAENYRKAITPNIPAMPSALAKASVPKVADLYKPLIPTSAFSGLTQSYARAVNKMLPAIHEELAKRVSKAMQGIMASIPKINKFFEAEEFKRFAEGLSKKQKSKFVDYIANDWYIPLDILKEFPILLPSETQLEIDEFVLSVFTELKNEHGVDVLDFVPKSLRIYKDKNTLEILLRENLYKQAVLFCMERIERVITAAQSVEKYKDIKINSAGLVEFEKITREESSNSEYISEIFEKLDVDEKSIRMFKPFYKVLEEGYEVLPLNRNLFFHGWVAEEDVDEGLVVKAILAWAFFEKLSVEKQKRNKKIPIGISRVKKYRKTQEKKSHNHFDCDVVD